MHYEQVLKFDPSAAPEGDCFDPKTPGRAFEQQYFPGWYNEITPWGYGTYRKMGSLMRIARDETVDGNVLEWTHSCLRYFVCDDRFVSDFQASATLRSVQPHFEGYHDVPGCDVSRLGIVFRYVDARHFYFFAMEGLRRLVLYRRDDDQWHELAQLPAELNAEKYYELRVEVIGSGMRCHCGDVELTASDDMYDRGRVGIRGTGICKVAQVLVQMTAGQKQFSATLRCSYERQRDVVRQRYPKPQLAKTLDLQQFKPESIEFMDLRNTRYPDIVITTRRDDSPHTIAVDLGGNVLWERKGQLYSHTFGVFRQAAAGHRELVTLNDRHFVVINLATGQTVDEPVFPRPVKHKLWQLHSGVADRPGNTRGVDTAGDMIVRFADGEQFEDENEEMMIIDDQFNELWSAKVASVGFGHTYGVQFFDFDGDGKDEVLAGYTLLTAQGKTIWELEACDDIVARPGGRHIDVAMIGNFAGDGDPVVFVNSGAIYVADGLTGQTRAIHAVGHAQSATIGNLRPDLPGLEYVSGNRWGNPGIINVIGARGEWLSRMQPTAGPLSHQAPVNWSGDGQELLLVQGYPVGGLFDADGWCVLPWPDEWCSEVSFARWPGVQFVDLLGDPRQEMVQIQDGVLSIYTQDRPPPDQARVYDPVRISNMSLPRWSDQR